MGKDERICLYSNDTSLDAYDVLPDGKAVVWIVLDGEREEGGSKSRIETERQT